MKRLTPSSPLTLTLTVLVLCGFAGSQLGCQEVKQPTTTLTQAQWEEVKQHILTEAPADIAKVGAVYGDRVELIGVKVDKDKLTPNGAFEVTYYWKALKDMQVNWMVFAHLDITGERSARQGLDHHPVRELYQTTRWKKGQIIKDVQSATLRQDYPGGEASIWVGLWNPATGKRLPVTNLDAVKHDKHNRVNTISIPIDAPKAKASARAKGQKRQRTYMARKLEGAITIDGKLDDEGWKRASRSTRFGGTRGGDGPDGNSWVKVLFDDENLYLGFFAEDKDIWGALTERDSDTWTQEVFEVFIDPEGDQKDYIEIQVTPRNTVFDARFAVKLGSGEGSTREQIDKARAWNSGLVSAVHVDGTLNDHTDEDRSWSVELKIPRKDIPGGTVATNKQWKINFYRFDAPRDKDGKPNGGGQMAWSWVPAMGSFHNIEHFGTLRLFGGLLGNKGNLTPKFPPPGGSNLPSHPSKIGSPEELRKRAIEKNAASKGTPKKPNTNEAPADRPE